MESIREYSGLWHSVYWFPSNKFVGEQPSEYDMQAHWDGDTLVLESVPNDIGAYMLIRLAIDEITGVATGNWYETTSPSGEFKSAQYSGAGQLVIDPETLTLEGKWAGAGHDHKLDKMRVYAGNWEIWAVDARVRQSDDELDLEGLWRSCYRYPSSGRDSEEFWGRHTVRATHSGTSLKFESVPDSASHVTVELHMDRDGKAAGTWREETDPHGYYKGAVYEGTIALSLSPDGKRLSGTWRGRGKNGEMNSDVWEITRDGVDAPGNGVPDGATGADTEAGAAADATTDKN
jgi:hypothetical protein